MHTYLKQPGSEKSCCLYATPYFVIDAVKQARYACKDGRLKLDKILEELERVALVEANAGALCNEAVDDETLKNMGQGEI